jgi:hypothetical protein
LLPKAAQPFPSIGSFSTMPGNLDLFRGMARGITADPMGGPVDLATTIANLGIAGGGYLAHKAGLINQPPDLIHKPILGSDWLVDKTPLQDDGSAEYTAGRLTGNILPLIGGLAKSHTPSPGTVNMFLGPMAKSADLSKRAEASNLYRTNLEPDHSIFRATGWERNANKDLRFEIPDNALTVNPFSSASQQFSHPQLIDNYPQLRDISTELSINPFEPIKGYFSAAQKKIKIQAPSKAELRSGVAHELQHAVDSIENFPSGGSPGSAYFQIFQASQGKTPEWRAKLIHDMARQLGKPIDQIPPNVLNQLIQGDITAYNLARTLPEKEIDRRLVLNSGLGGITPYQAYLRLMGETNANNTETRLNFSDLERRALSPRSTEKYHHFQQFYAPQQKP